MTAFAEGTRSDKRSDKGLETTAFCAACLEPLAGNAKNLMSFFWCCSPKTRRNLKLPSAANRSVADRARRSAVEILRRER
jgi:hypothetical protein